MPEKIPYSDVPVGAIWVVATSSEILRRDLYLKFAETDPDNSRKLTSVYLRRPTGGDHEPRNEVWCEPDQLAVVINPPGEHQVWYDKLGPLPPEHDVLRSLPDIPQFT